MTDYRLRGMAFSLRAIFRLAWRHAWRRPIQSLFLVVGVAIGVAMIVAIDLANSSAQRAFELATDTVTGRSTHQIVGGPNGIDQSIYTALRLDIGYRLSAPIVESYVTVVELDGQPMRLMGVDPFAEAPFRSYLGPGEGRTSEAVYLAPLLTQPGSVLISADVAARYGIRVGSTLAAQLGTKRYDLTIAGLLEPADDLSRRALETLLVADVSTAQEVLGRVGRLDRIDLIVPDGADGASALERISGLLPDGARIASNTARGGTVSEMTAAFRLNLTALSLLALVVGMFLIYNTVAFSVVQRRAVIGTLRSLGMTRSEIYALILGEAVLLGLVGTLVGLLLGILLGRGAVQLVTRTINDLFFVVSVREIDISRWTLTKGAIIGVAAAAAAAAAPAWEATSVPPAGALQRSSIETRSAAALPWITVGAAALMVVGLALLLPEWNLVVAFAGLFAVIVGAALFTPLLTLAFMRAGEAVAGRGLGVIARMAPRSIIRSLSRTSVALAALMVAVSVIIGVGIMIGSFRTTVELWLQEVLQADIFVSPPSLIANRNLATLDPETVAEFAAVQDIERVATTREIDATIFLPISSAPAAGQEPDPADQAITVRLAALSDDIAGENRRYRASVGDWRATWDAVVAGGIVVNEPMANRYDLQVGQLLQVQTDRGRHGFMLVGISVGFDVNPVIFMHDSIYRQWWDDTAVSAMGLFVAPGADVDDKIAQLRRAWAGRGDLLIRSNRATRENALDVFDRTFAITVALQLLATIVAFIGVLSTLMSLQLARRREIGVLRATGMTRRQLWRLSLLETGLIGAVAGILAIPTGYLLAAILIYIINLRSFGWTLAMRLDPWEFVQAFLVALGAALAAGIYPAWRMGNTPPADAVRAE